MRALILAMALLVGPVHAQYDAIAADAVSTAGALAAGGVEINPLGWGTVPARLLLLEYAKTLSPSRAVQVRHGVRIGGYGAAANNIGVMLGLHGAPVIGLFVAVGMWAGGREEREFWAICEREREYWGKPDMACTYTPGPAIPPLQPEAP